MGENQSYIGYAIITGFIVFLFMYGLPVLVQIIKERKS